MPGGDSSVDTANGEVTLLSSMILLTPFSMSGEIPRQLLTDQAMDQRYSNGNAHPFVYFHFPIRFFMRTMSLYPNMGGPASHIVIDEALISPDSNSPKTLLMESKEILVQYQNIRGP